MHPEGLAERNPAEMAFGPVRSVGAAEGEPEPGFLEPPGALRVRIGARLATGGSHTPDHIISGAWGPSGVHFQPVFDRVMSGFASPTGVLYVLSP
jgi:hypothetical protein